jgi:RNA polymerase I-specific transcription initiation factor RRN6
MNTPSRGEAVPVPHSARAASQGTQLLASSQAPPNMFTSQIQPGKFGGKPAKKKRRVVGF